MREFVEVIQGANRYLIGPSLRDIGGRVCRKRIGTCEEMCPMSEVCTEHSSAEGVLNPLSSLWPFAQWGLDIIGPFPKAIGNRRWLLVGTDYFTK